MDDTSGMMKVNCGCRSSCAGTGCKNLGAGDQLCPGSASDICCCELDSNPNVCVHTLSCQDIPVGTAPDYDDVPDCCIPAGTGDPGPPFGVLASPGNCVEGSSGTNCCNGVGNCKPNGTCQ
jgi:hypothetical protein